MTTWQIGCLWVSLLQLFLWLIVPNRMLYNTHYSSLFFLCSRARDCESVIPEVIPSLNSPIKPNEGSSY